MAKWLLVPFFLLPFLSSSNIFNYVTALSVDSQPMWNIVASFSSPMLPSSWENGTDPCEGPWINVGCKKGRVTRLEFYDLQLSGTLHPSIAKLSALQSVDLSNNPLLSGPLPSFANLAFLDTLILHDTAFSSIPADFFSGLIRLRQVSMDNIPLAPWSLPSSLSCSLNLTDLSASNACITGEIPGEFRFSESHTFIVLDFSCHNFSGTISPRIAEFTMLKRIVLSNNRLQGIIPESLTTLPALQLLDVTNNNLSGKVPTFRSTITLKLSGNHFAN